jgi:hypothetical protein
MAISNTKGNGGMIILRVRANSITIRVVTIGSNMKGNSEPEISKVSGSCFTRMETGTKDSSETTYCGAKGGCSVKTAKSSRPEYGKWALLYLNCDSYFFLFVQCSVD